MSVAVPPAARGDASPETPYLDLRDWLERVDRMGELRRVEGVHWDREMGSLMQLVNEQLVDRAPALLYDAVPGYPRGFRTLYGQLTNIPRLALTVGLPTQWRRKADFARAFQQRMYTVDPIAPREVSDGPILENVALGDDVDVLKLPIPIHHELDKARYIGTACCVITKDPDSDWINLGAYRSQVYDARTVGCQISDGKDGRIFRDTYFARGQPMKVAIACGQDPLLYLLASSPVPRGLSDYDLAGGLKGHPIDVIRGPYTGFPIPAHAEIVIEGDITPGDVLPEGPFGEWTGYYSDDERPRPVVRVRSLLHRNDPILTCAPQHKPLDETVVLHALGVSAGAWQALEAAGIPDVRGVWSHEGGLGIRFLVISIKQRYPGHARNALHVAAGCQAASYNGKWVIVVDDDIDPADSVQVLWALSTRFDPVTDIDLMQRAWSSRRDPMVVSGAFNNRVLIDACIPYERKERGDFPPVVDVSAAMRARLDARLSEIVGSLGV